MKTFKNLLILTLCFTFMVTTVDTYNSYANYEISPLEHYTNDSEKK